MFPLSVTHITEENAHVTFSRSNFILQIIVLASLCAWSGRGAQIIGTVTAEDPGLVVMRTTLGTTRIVDMLAGDQLPRIC